MEYVLIILSAIFVNNIILSQIPGIYPLIGTNTKSQASLGIGASMLVVMTLSTIIYFQLNQYVLIPLGLPFLRIVSYTLIVMIFVQIIEMVIKKVNRFIYQSIEISSPLFAIDCIIIGIAILVLKKNFTLAESIVFAAASSLGYALVLLILSGIREQLELAEVPKEMTGIPIALITAGILALAFMGFAGLG